MLTLSNIYFISCVGCVGWLYRGVCLQSQVVHTHGDHIPIGCTAYKPSRQWTYSDYVAICQHFHGSSNCANWDSDWNGGRCSNHRAILAYENNYNPDVWVAADTFTWSPSYLFNNQTQDCTLVTNLPGTLVYACLGVSISG